MIKYTGTTHSFECSEDSWNAYKDIIKAWCDGESVEIYEYESWVDVYELNEKELLACRVKPKQYSKSYPKVGEVWKDPLVDSYFVICKDTDKTGQVFWIEESKISNAGFNYKQIVFENHCEKICDSLGDYIISSIKGEV